jgi:hypothetical protein
MGRLIIQSLLVSVVIAQRKFRLIHLKSLVRGHQTKKFFAISGIWRQAKRSIQEVKILIFRFNSASDCKISPKRTLRVQPSSQRNRIRRFSQRRERKKGKSLTQGHLLLPAIRK